jgi:hypothetical protein
MPPFMAAFFRWPEMLARMQFRLSFRIPTTSAVSEELIPDK